MIHPSELVLNQDGSIYHLNLQPDEIASKIILVGDPARVSLISSHFEKIEHRKSNREFVTHTGIYNGERLSVIATGIGTDNIDIVLNELDALVNIDLEKRTVNKRLKSLSLIRIGTCGSIQEKVKADELVISTHAIGLDGLLHFYQLKSDAEEEKLLNAFLRQTNWSKNLNPPYLVSGSKSLIAQIGKGFHHGITITANGFYAPQGRSIRMPLKNSLQNTQLRKFKEGDQQIINYEMETSALYGLSKIMGHQACTVCAVIANRYANSFSKNYQITMKSLIKKVLDRLTKKSE